MDNWKYTTRAKYDVLATLARAGYLVGSIPDAIALGILTNEEWSSCPELHRRQSSVKGRAV